MSKKRILHYGLQRSGTNFLRDTIQQRFDVEFINTLYDRSHQTHKHFRLYDDKSLIGRPNYFNELIFKNFKDFENRLSPEFSADAYIILSKDPYCWYLSYIKWGKRHKWPPSPHPYMMEYNEFYKKWLKFSQESNKVVMFKYVDLLSDMELILKTLQSRFNLEQNPGNKLKEKRIKKVAFSPRFTSKKIRYYLKEEYILEFEPQLLAELNDQIDHNLIRKLGYKSYF